MCYPIILVATSYIAQPVRMRSRSQKGSRFEMRAAEIFYFLLRMPFLSPDLRVKIEAYSPVIGAFQIDKRAMTESHKKYIPYSPDLRVKIEAYSPVIGDFQIDKSKVLTSVILGAI